MRGSTGRKGPIAVLSAEDALRQSQRLRQLGFDMSPQRLQEISAGARPNPDECQAVRVAEVISAIDSGISPEEAAAADAKTEKRKPLVLAALVVAFAVLLILLLIASL